MFQVFVNFNKMIKVCGFINFMLMITTYKVYTMGLVINTKMTWILMWLNLVVLMLMLMSFKTSMINMTSSFYFLSWLSFIIIIMFFMSSSLIGFFILFELTLIPVMLIINSWGYQPERLQASYYLMMYTMMFSLPFIMVLIMIMMKCNSMNMIMIFSMNMENSVFMLVFSLGVFFVKCPLYFIHLWLPKAHVEAPIMGSILLAGVLLKLGGYGVYRFIFMFKMMDTSFTWLYTMCLLSLSLSILVVIVQVDQKLLIAYASVNHMSLIILSLATGVMSSLKGIMILMFIHGVVSSFLFIYSNMVYYTKSSRLLMFGQGFSLLGGFLYLFVFVMSILNFSVPPFLSFYSEVSLFISLYIKCKMLLLLMIILVVLSCYYSMYLFINIIHGKSTSISVTIDNNIMMSVLNISGMSVVFLASLMTNFFFLFNNFELWFQNMMQKCLDML